MAVTPWGPAEIRKSSRRGILQRMAELPIQGVLPELLGALRKHGAAVLQAPPGAGKTTRVPLALLDESWLASARIVMLEPRRLAARAAASYMARLLGEEVGGTVGYRVRMDTRVGPGTRIEVVTEGVLTRMLQNDPSLEGVGIVLFDEFHERSLHADVGLALTLQSRALFRPDLHVLVMSATLDGAPIAKLLSDAPIVTSEGRAYPVDRRYLSRKIETHVEPVLARQVHDALHANDGDILAFLPGAGEIRRAAERLNEALQNDSQLRDYVDVVQLHGQLAPGEQDRAIAPSPPGRRKVVLATSIAETSLTIEGVRVVVDSGLMRIPRFSPRTGMTRLETVRVTRASAEQRAGRAGRVAPGTTYRLWTEGEHAGLLDHGRPEILDADLAPLALELAVWGVADPNELPWLDGPPAGSYAQAQELLRELGAFDTQLRLTDHGRQMAELSIHPRLAHMILRGTVLDHGALACDLAALLLERDIFRGSDLDPDVRLRLDAMHGRGHSPHIDRGAMHRANTQARELRRMLRIADSRENSDAAGLLLAFAYPDRIAMRRGEQRGGFTLRNGRGGRIDAAFPIAAEPWLVAAEVGGSGRDSRIFLAAPITRAEIDAHFSDQFEREDVIEWTETGFRAMRRTSLGALVLGESGLKDIDPEQRISAIVQGIRTLGIDTLPWSKSSRALQQRLLFLRNVDDSWPDVSDTALNDSLEQWLAPFLHDVRSRNDLARIDLTQALLSMLDWQQRRQLDELAPTHIVVPSDSNLPIDYSDAAVPALAVRLQEIFGWTETPRLAGGRVPLTLQLLSPARRPVQITRDLASFWRTGYFDVKKDLKGRYPKHYWPDDPFDAIATRRVRPPREQS